ncbi:MAG: cobalamin-dependent protein [Candidatus Aminicenantes bacterium]|nr:cobalamin-dependent protein [Candidatus Aminicenantes bacterium]
MIEEAVYKQYFEALVSGDRSRCAGTVSQLIDRNITTETIYTDLFQKSLYRIGELWEQSRVSVAVEHLATAITEQLLSQTYPRLLADRRPNNRRAVISCSVNEYHQVGARMVSDIMESRGWDVWFLGANTPVTDLLEMIQEKKPDVVGLSISIYFNMAPLVRTIDAVRTNFSDLDIIVGGQAFRWGGAELIKPFSGTHVISNSAEWIKTLGSEAY